MSNTGIQQQHSEWQGLIDRSGPFLSLPVLCDVFPAGLPGDDTEQVRRLRVAYDEWRSNPDKPEFHQAWVGFVLNELLEYDQPQLIEGQAIPSSFNVNLRSQGLSLRPDIVLNDPSSTGGPGTPRMLISYYDRDQKLDRHVAGSSFSDSPIAQMQELLRNVPVQRANGQRIELGLVTNGEAWALICAPANEATSIATWYADIWLQERTTLRAFQGLLGQQRLTGVDDNDQLESLFRRSLENQQEVTDQLGAQVRRAVEVLVQTFDRIDRDRGRSLLSGVSEKQVYDAALTVMMRLVFLFSAEENGLLLLGDETYDENYAVSLMREQLREEADKYGEEVLGNRRDAWCRLLAAFRTVYGGCDHEDLRIPAHGGSLFDPDKYPFLEGRSPGTSWLSDPSDPLPVDNRTVLHLLSALQELEVKGSKNFEAATRVLSFRGLDIEQIGHVYEGLLDHTAKRSAGPVLGLSGKKEPEIALSKLEELHEQGQAKLLDFLVAETGRSANAIKKALDKPENRWEHRLITACGNDEELQQRVMPFVGLLREDTLGYPVVIPAGSLYVTLGSLRRSTGTHYTQRTLTEPIVRHTLEPLCCRDVDKGVEPSPGTLKSAREILSLKVCDMAMGSGAFLVQACRYLAERLIEAWELAIRNAGPTALLVTPYAEHFDNAIEERLIEKKNIEERSVIARRLVAERCLYGVDINPMAVEMAKLSLWLTTMSRNRPFSFVDHALKCGDSLLGVDSRQLAALSLNAAAKVRTHDIFMSKALDEATDLRRQLESFSSENIDDVQRKLDMHRRAEAKLERLKLGGDIVIAPYIGHDRQDDIVRVSTELNGEYIAYIPQDTGDSLALKATVEADRQLRKRVSKLMRYTNNDGEEKQHTTFHWQLEFPEVFRYEGQYGFDAFVGNPPFLGGQKLTGVFGTAYREYLVEQLAGGMRGSADFCSYFFLRAFGLLKEDGHFGMLATNTIAQGDTRQVGLSQITANGGSIYRANASRKWPGVANLEVAEVWLRNGNWQGQHVLVSGDAAQPVKGITPYLVPPGKVSGDPYRLKANEGKSFIGSYVLGMGFVMSPHEAEALINKDPKNRDVLFPYLNGEDLNSRPDQSPSRWVINFFDWPLKRKDIGVWSAMDDKARRKCLQDGIVPLDYPDPVAADYPDCLDIIINSVKPQREELIGTNAIGTKRGLNWWKYASESKILYEEINKGTKILAIARTAKFRGYTYVEKGLVLDVNLVLFSADYNSFLQLQSSMHEVWVNANSSTLESRQGYRPSDCFDTYPLTSLSNVQKHIEDDLIQQRLNCMKLYSSGLTKTYNRFHDSAEQSEDIARLRELHVEMDQAVALAYGWDDLELGHGFHETKQGLRYTISEEARREVLDRLLALNIRRYAEEVAQGLHNKDKKLDDKIPELLERLEALNEPDLIQRVKNRPTGKQTAAKKSRGRKSKDAGTGGLF